MVRHTSSTKYPRSGDVLLATEDGFMLMQRERDGQSGYWYLIYHNHYEGDLGEESWSLSPMMSPIDRGGKATGYKCMTCSTPIHEGLEFLMKMLYWEQSQ
jgi:hypothetical protein